MPRGPGPRAGLTPTRRARAARASQRPGPLRSHGACRERKTNGPRRGWSAKARAPENPLLGLTPPHIQTWTSGRRSGSATSQGSGFRCCLRHLRASLRPRRPADAGALPAPASGGSGLALGSAEGGGACPVQLRLVDPRPKLIFCCVSGMCLIRPDLAPCGPFSYPFFTEERQEIFRDVSEVKQPIESPVISQTLFWEIGLMSEKHKNTDRLGFTS